MRVLAVVALALMLCGTAQAATVTKSPGDDLNVAYQAAQPGDVIELTAGSYGNVRIGARTVSGEIVIRPKAGAAVSFNDLLVFGSGLRVQDVTIPCCYGQPDVRAPAQNVVIENVKATNFYVTGTTKNVTIRGGEYGPYVSTGGGSQIKSASAGGDGTDYPVDTVVDGVYVHDYTVPTGSGAHLDCLHVFYHQRVTIKNSRFKNCEHYGIFLGSNGPGRVDGDVIVGNSFEGAFAVAGFALRGGTGEDFNDVLVQGNRGGMVTPQSTQDGLTNVRWWDNNVSSVGGVCRAGIDYKRNVIANGPLCDATDSRTVSEPPPPPPPADTDGDGVTDLQDACPATPGTGLDGCPPPPADPCEQTKAERDQALTDLAAMTASRDAQKARADAAEADRDAWKARAVKAEDQRDRIRAITGE